MSKQFKRLPRPEEAPRRPVRRPLCTTFLLSALFSALFSALQIAPKWSQYGFQNGSKIDPGASWRALGAVLAAWWSPGGLLERFLEPLGASWKALGPKKTPLDRLLAAPRGFPREVSAILRAKRLPKRSPGGSKIGSRRRLELKTAKSQNFEDVSWNSLIFKVPGRPFWDQNGTKIGSQSQHRR